MRTELFTPEVWREQLAPYRVYLAGNGRRSSTVRMRIYHLRRFAVRSGLAPFDVTLDNLLEHLSYEGWGPAARRATQASLRKFYNWAHVTGRLDHNPAGLLEPIYVPIGHARPASEESTALGLNYRDPRVPLMVELGDRCGMRCCEIAVIRTDDVSGPVGRRRLLVHGKGGKERVIDISDSLASRLLEHPAGYIFPGRIDGHLSNGYVSKLLSRALGTAATGHMLRHKGGTRVLKTSGGNLRIAQEFLGHASPATTQIYTQVDGDELRAAVLAA